MPYEIIVGRNAGDKKLFGNRGLAYIGKTYVKMGQYTSLSNKMYMDVSRSHVILIAGKRGCLTEDTQVFTNRGYKKISEFNEKKDKILSYNKDKNIFEWEDAKLLEYPLEKEKLLQITLEDGRIIKLTKEHPLLSSYGKYKYYRKAYQLKEKDKIILPTNLPEIKEDKESLRIARLLGYILADGTIHIQKGIFKDGRGKPYNGTKARIRIFNQSEEVLTQAKEDFEKEFNITAKRYKRNDCNCEIIETKHQNIINKFMNLGVPKGLKSGIIRIPEIVFQSSNKFKAEFISALFDCDGYVPATGRNLDYSSKSREFLEDLQRLLTHFNIESVIRVKNAKLNNKIYPSYRLFITDNNSIENFKKINFRNKFKQERLEKHKSNGTQRRKTHYPEKNLVCTKIKEIKEIEGTSKVYDLTVDKNHSFIANGIISHNSGKSYTLGAIAEELSNLPEQESQNISSLIFDTMGIYWTMKTRNDKDKNLLSDWELKTKSLPVKVFVPYGYYDLFADKGISIDEKFALDISELEIEDWIITFNLEFIHPVAVLIQRAMSFLKEKRKKFTIKDIIKTLEEDKKSEKETINAAVGLFEAASTWGIFADDKNDATKIKDIITRGKTSVLDLSMYNSVGAFNIRALVISLLCRKIFKERMIARKQEEINSISKGLNYGSFQEKKQVPLVWLFIDEAHEFLPLNGKTIATDALTQILREGRQPGISLVLATQQPGQIHKDVMTQSDLVISHRVTSEQDIQALNNIMQTYLTSSIQKYMNDLPSSKGSAIILDDNSERIYPVQIRPRFTWHGGDAPTAISFEEEM